MQQGVKSILYGRLHVVSRDFPNRRILFYPYVTLVMSLHEVWQSTGATHSACTSKHFQILKGTWKRHLLMHFFQFITPPLSTVNFLCQASALKGYLKHTMKRKERSNRQRTNSVCPFSWEGLVCWGGRKKQTLHFYKAHITYLRECISWKASNPFQLGLLALKKRPLRAPSKIALKLRHEIYECTCHI